ncbi:DUF3618 domain-containing protein [Corynebacterium mendelii]|uniref:DUF3618 domain-containing protein n=1 Tax=Corynebacterium mendelii TaxID=2765362 RepID=A0A939E269_9CORY|nr:DUF3618 domain-containing protein [Corynebacterium mendelii]MBN9644142.1 DUF3618 domain-containing protein [Corynebacterium mendelii]
MARDINDIERDIARTRRQLAGTLDELADRTQPKKLVDDAKKDVTGKLQDPTVQKVLAGVAGAVALLVVIGVARSRRKNKDLREIRRILAERG